MLDIFVGGYLFHPAALDFSGDKCRNGCAYCFANINKEDRACKLKPAINALYKKQVTTYQDMLLKDGYPILVSNRSDPFTEKNARDSVAFFTHLAERKAGVFIQTKTGPGLDECLAIMGDRRDVVVYITITTLRDDIAAVLEPGAPLPSARIETAKRLHKAGYLVLVAVNPCCEAWMPREDLESLVKELRSAGMNHVCIEMLDIKRKRFSLLSESRKKRLGEAVKTLGKANQMYVRDCTEWLVKNGVSVAKKGMPFRSTLFDDIKSRLGVTMPVFQDFVNYCFDKHGSKESVLLYSEFEKTIAQDEIFLKTVKQNTIRAYLFRSGFESWKDNQQIHSHKELLKIVWNDPRHRISIQRHSLFRVVGHAGKPTLDKNGDIQLFFNGKANLGKKEVIEI